eukprot:TRINITY_DN9975_c0_g1_i2.p1 TRINITY_DN9975_c0_g1~~TRINITY_DN9975_c0_g1_i2.p1  ORF type:complete len:202 (+),score=22.35 TRINITY_DN9975_c0_g1_i2:280-885(+)
MAGEMGQVSAACDEMHQVAALLMSRVDRIQLPSTTTTTPPSQITSCHMNPPAVPLPQAVNTSHGVLSMDQAVSTSHQAVSYQPNPPVPLEQVAMGLGERLSEMSSLGHTLKHEQVLALRNLYRHIGELLDPRPKTQAEPLYKCWICEETDKLDQLSVQCGCPDRFAHPNCLGEWIEMLDGNPAANKCAACNQLFQSQAPLN